MTPEKLKALWGLLVLPIALVMGIFLSRELYFHKSLQGDDSPLIPRKLLPVVLIVGLGGAVLGVWRSLNALLR
jgi:hypothetical protein